MSRKLKTEKRFVKLTIMYPYNRYVNNIIIIRIIPEADMEVRIVGTSNEFVDLCQGVFSVSNCFCLTHGVLSSRH